MGGALVMPTGVRGVRGVSFGPVARAPAQESCSPAESNPADPANPASCGRCPSAASCRLALKRSRYRCALEFVEEYPAGAELEVIADALGVSLEAVRMVIVGALRKLKPLAVRSQRVDRCKADEHFAHADQDASPW
jgi:hypothetical protein